MDDIEKIVFNERLCKLIKYDKGCINQNEINFKNIGIVLTDKCNAECDMCVFSCKLTNNTVMNLDEVYRYIKQSKEVKSIKTICITGGEPFLFYDKLLKIVSKIKEQGFDVTVTTNGFWGKNFTRAKKILMELRDKGVKNLEISFDQFHLDYIDKTSINNILSIAHELGYNITLYSVITKSSMSIKELRKMLEPNIHNYMIKPIYCAPVGRAKEKINANDFISIDEIPRQCCSRQYTLCILPNGDSYPCCSHSNFRGLLSLGSTKNNSIGDIAHKFENNVFCTILKYYGTSWFLDAIKANNLPIKIKHKYVSVCGLCDDLFCKYEYANYYRSSLEQLYKQLSKKYDLII